MAILTIASTIVAVVRFFGLHYTCTSETTQELLLIAPNTTHSMAPPTFTGGKLFKKKAKKKSRKSKHERKAEDTPTTTSAAAAALTEEDDDLTEAERTALYFKKEKEKRDLLKVANMSHRERVEEFNSKLAELTEHNDIPRVSAAGNG